MSGQTNDQSVDGPMTRVKSHLECPVCFNIPRDLPIPSCPSGHIVCRPCKTRVNDCPTCRQPMPPNMTNSLAGALIEQVQHKCKFADQGCKVKMMLKDLVTHEKECPDRTIKCPWPGCGLVVKLNSFDSHALGPDVKHSRIVSLSKWTILRSNALIFGHNTPSMGSIRDSVLGELFHVNLSYHKPRKCFVFSIWLAKSQDFASNYVGDLVIQGDNNKLSYEGIKVSSVENVPSIDKCIEETGNISLCLPTNLAKNVSVKKEVDGAIIESLSVDFSFEKL